MTKYRAQLRDCSRLLSTSSKSYNKSNSFKFLRGNSFPKSVQEKKLNLAVGLLQQRCLIWTSCLLQSVQKAAARLVFRIRRSGHITDALVSVYWLRITERISYNLAVLMYRTINAWISAVTYHYQDNGRRCLPPIVWHTTSSPALRTAGELSQFPAPTHGTIFHTTSHLDSHLRFSDSVSRHIPILLLIPGHYHLTYTFCYTICGPSSN